MVGVAEAMLGVLAPFGDDVADVAARVRRSVVLLRGRRGGAGSGVVWSADGTIITNAHVASGGLTALEVPDGRTGHVRVVRVAPDRDLAMVQTDVGGLTPAEPADSRLLRPGEVVLAVGNPQGVRGAVTMGILSAVGALWPGQRGDALVANILLRPGNSGGPLVDSLGRVVGVNSMTMGHRVGVAVPTHVVQAFLRGPVIGIAVSPVRLPSEFARLAGGAQSGVVVLTVQPGSVAECAGLLQGDILLTVNGVAASGSLDWDGLLPGASGGVLRLEVIRGGALKTLQGVL